MRCVLCNDHLPTDNYALVEGAYFCLPCFLEQHVNHLILTGESKPSFNRSISNSNVDELGSTTSSNNIQSRKISDAVRRLSSVITKKFRQSRDFPATSLIPTSLQKPPRRSKASDQTCQVCFDEKSSTHFPPLINHLCLQNPRTICNTCVYRHIQQSFQEMCNDDVRCPQLQCAIKYDYETVKHILLSNKDKKLFERYDRFLIHHQLEQMEEFIWCSNPKCQMGQLNDGGKLNNIVTCMYCRKKTCFTHKTKWHEGMTCEEYDLGVNNDVKASLQWLNQNTKTCPKCPYQIEKNDGCDHMTCIKCQHEFCWACLADYNQIRKDGNHRHHPNCKHYTSDHQ